MSAPLWVACAARTIIVILTIVGEIGARQELCGCHRSPCLTDSHLKKSPCSERLSSLSCLPLICSPQPQPRTHTHTHAHAHTHTHTCTHTHTHTAFLCPSHNSVRQQLSPSATSVPCPLREDDMCLMAKITALSTFSVCSAAGTPQPEGGGGGGGGGGT